MVLLTDITSLSAISEKELTKMRGKDRLVILSNQDDNIPVALLPTFCALQVKPEVVSFPDNLKKNDPFSLGVFYGRILPSLKEKAKIAAYYNGELIFSENASPAPRNSFLSKKAEDVQPGGGSADESRFRMDDEPSEEADDQLSTPSWEEEAPSPTPETFAEPFGQEDEGEDAEDFSDAFEDEIPEFEVEESSDDITIGEEEAKVTAKHVFGQVKECFPLLPDEMLKGITRAIFSANDNQASLFSHIKSEVRLKMDEGDMMKLAGIWDAAHA